MRRLIHEKLIIFFITSFFSIISSINAKELNKCDNYIDNKDIKNTKIICKDTKNVKIADNDYDEIVSDMVSLYKGNFKGSSIRKLNFNAFEDKKSKLDLYIDSKNKSIGFKYKFNLN